MNRMCCGGVCCSCPANRVLWVNTIGTRTPELSLADLSRAGGKLRSWAGRLGADVGPGLADYLTVISPTMWPGFRRNWQRKFNARSVTQAVHHALGPRVPGEERIAITTLPITADLVGKLDVDRWVYYCVDDFSVWPGLDSSVMQTMERELVGQVDDLIAVSQTLRERLAGMGRGASLLTHGIDVDHWMSAAERGENEKPRGWPAIDGPVVLFWGLIDRRLDIHWCRALSEGLTRRGGTLVLAGPQQSPDPAIHQLANTVLPGPVSYDDLPRWAAMADVLVMPYADAPVTRAMQPLKLKEYLATGRPVVVRDLPSTRPWYEAADVVDNAEAFVGAVMARIETGTPAGHTQARRRLASETWSEKARQFASIWIDTPDHPMKHAA